MIIKIQSTLRLCGELVIKLINKIKNHLYTYILFSTVIALFFSLLIWLGLSRTAKFIYLTDYSNRAESIKEEISSRIEDENFSYYDALENIDSLKYNRENIRLMSYNEADIKPDYKMIFDDKIVYKFPMKYSDGYGMLLIKPIGKIIPDYYEYGILLISVLVFMIILFCFIRKPIKYIEEIQDNIEIIAGGKLSHKIPIKGNYELSHLAANINEMGNQLKENVEKEKENDIKQRQLITNISHDLRTPLTVMLGYLDLLRIKAYETEEECEDFISSSYNKCCQLQELIEDLFTYNKIINGDISINFENIEMIDFISKTISGQRIKINLYHDQEEIFIRADKKLLLRILDNIFNNIEKYGSEGTDVNIQIKEENGIVKIIVENSTDNDLTGKVENIFERTYVGNKSRSNKSSGLGLSIVAESIKLMQGKVYAIFEKPLFKVIMEFDTEN